LARKSETGNVTLKNNMKALTVIGTMIGLVVGFVLASRLHPQPDWRLTAQLNTMADRRAYTLPLNNPDMIPAAQASYMNQDDVVLGLLIHGEARAYPWWLVSNYHVVNDTVNQEPLLITLCEICGGAVAFRPVVPDLPELPLSFQICGIRHGTIEIADYQTLSHWHPFLGIALTGPLKGTSLETYPLLLMTWKDWQGLYPGSVVANGSPQLRERPHGAQAGRIGDPSIPIAFMRSANLTDHRLGTHDLVLGIKPAGSDQAYAIPANQLVPFPNLFLTTVGSKTVLIARQTELAITAFYLEPAGYQTELVFLSKAPIRFRSPDGLVWNGFGISTGVGKEERRLPSTRCYLTEWYEWVSHSPQSEIVSSVKVLPFSGEVQ
jgi:hypothetical protein